MLAVTANVASNRDVNSWRRQVDVQFVLLLLRFFLFLEDKPCVLRSIIRELLSS